MKIYIIWMAAFYGFVILMMVRLDKIINGYVNEKMKNKKLRYSCNRLVDITTLSTILSIVAKSLSFKTSVIFKMQALDNMSSLFNGVGGLALSTVLSILFWTSQIKNNND